jgi:single-strand DNA-binding protein
MEKLILIGKLGRDPETKEYSGKSMTKFSVAIDKKVKGQKETKWYSCVAFDKLGEIAMLYLKKGCTVYLEGNPSSRLYKNKDGQEVMSNELAVNFMEITSFPPGERTQGNANGNVAPRQDNGAFGGTKFDDLGDLPF